MTGASVLYYGRRNRPARTASDFGFSSSDDRHRSRSREAVTTATTASVRRDRAHARSDQHAPRNHSGEFGESGRSASFRLQPCSLEGIALESGPLQLHGGDTQAPVQNIVHGDIVSCNRDRVDSGQRLPRSVLLAKERLLQRLRGLPSPSSVRQGHESSSSSHSNNYWPNNSGNEHISISSGRMAESSFASLVSMPLTLSREALASCHHAVFTEAREGNGSPDFRDSDECCICLEKFKDGNELTRLPCGHRFHSFCLSPWIQSYGKCPYCRSGISSN